MSGVRGGDRTAQNQAGSAGIVDAADAPVLRHGVHPPGGASDVARTSHRPVAVIHGDKGEPHRSHLPLRVDLIHAAFLRRWPFEDAVEPDWLERRRAYLPAQQPAAEIEPDRPTAVAPLH